MNEEQLEKLIMALTEQRITVSVKKTVQERQYEPKDIFVGVSVVADPTSEKIKNLLDLCENEVMSKHAKVPVEKQVSGFTNEQKELKSKFDDAFKKLDFFKCAKCKKEFETSEELLSHPCS